MLTLEKRRRSKWRFLGVAAILAGLAWLGLWAFRTGGTPRLAVAPELPAIGRRTPVRVVAEEPGRGVARLRIEVVQGERRELVLEESYPTRPPWAFWGPRQSRLERMVEVGWETVEGLRSGEAAVRASAWPAGTWLRSPEAAVAEAVLPVRLTPPSLEILSNLHYLRQGGCEAVAYRVGETAVRDGVQAGDRWFPGYPLPGGGPGEHFALFAAPYDLSDPSQIRLVAADDVGNEAAAPFVDRFFPKPFATDTIHLRESFMGKVVPEILSRTPDLSPRGSLLENYLAINGELRRRNAETLRELAARSRPAFLWREPFLAMPNAQVTSAFADRRTYLFDGREVDRQDHLGFDLASVARAEVPAANSGVAVLARYLGIYGNSVVLDHGYGLMTLYGHLSSLAVAEGEEVARGQTIGRTGDTGLAGGDHLHFTVLLQGLPVNPLEWWDRHWIEDRIDRKLGPASPLG